LTDKFYYDKIYYMDIHSKRDIGREYISKLELLGTMHITSSQLYSWKRKGLIPKEWFVKKVTRTGQITVFPRKLIVTRIRDILRYKEKYSLDKVEKLISPETTNRRFSLGEILRIKEINPDILDENKTNFTYTEILVLIVLTDFQKKIKATGIVVSELIDILFDVEIRVETDTVVIAEYKGEYFSIITVDDNVYIPDSGCRIVCRYNMCEVSEEFKKKYESMLVVDREEMVRKCIETITKEIGGV
jgi:DNA-binding transcriptional MerR regulator